MAKWLDFKQIPNLQITNKIQIPNYNNQGREINFATPFLVFESSGLSARGGQVARVNN